MADRVSIAIRQDQAFKRLTSAMNTFAERFGVEPVVIPTQGRDTDLLRAMQFEALAGWAESAIEALPLVNADSEDGTPEEKANPYAGMKKAQLVLEARTREIDVSVLKTPDELIDALLASDGVTEDEQQALDTGAAEAAGG